MNSLQDHEVIKALHRETSVTLEDLTEGRLYIEPPREPSGHIELGAWFLCYAEGLPPADIERLRSARQSQPRLVRAAALVVASVQGRLSKQQQFAAFDYARYTIASAREALTDEYEAKAQKYAKAEDARTAPLKGKTDVLRRAKEATQAEAKELWHYDTEKELRTGEVAELLHEKAAELAGEKLTLPVVKGWVREVAPDYAKKGGRPKKTI